MKEVLTTSTTVRHGQPISEAVRNRQSNPTGAVRSRKENKQEPTPIEEVPEDTSGDIARKVAQPFLAASNSSGSKRQRITTPVARGVTDQENEPISSPTIRKASHALLAADDNNSMERLALSAMHNIF